MLSKETEQKLIELFIYISEGEDKINVLKQNIISNFTINPFQLFFRLDENKMSRLSKENIISFLSYYSIEFTVNDIDYLFFFFDKDDDTFLSFDEFLDLLISDSNYLFKKSIKKKFRHNNFNQNDTIEENNNNIDKCFLDILIEEINYYRKINDIIISLKHCNDFSIQDVFYEIKSYSYITNDSIKAFLDRNEFNYDDKFIKNILNRFETKNLKGKIAFNKFKNFFGLSYKQNMNKFSDNFVPQTINQTYNSGDIKFYNSTSFANITLNNNNNNNIKLCNNNNEKYFNEEDIQFECSHLSRSGSIESKNNINNKNIVLGENSQNVVYQNYLRDKRNKSIEKNISRSLSKGSDNFLKSNENNISYAKNTINIKPIRYEENNNSINHDNYVTNTVEDLPMNLPIRLNKNLVKRPLPKRNMRNNINCDKEFNYCYDRNDGKLNSNSMNFDNDRYCSKTHHHHCHQHKNFCDLYHSHNFENAKNNEGVYSDHRSQRRKYNDERFNYNLDWKTYKEDFN